MLMIHLPNVAMAEYAKGMDFKDYQDKALATDLFGGKPQPVTSPAFLEKLLGLVGETGEIAEKVKKIIRDKDGQVSEEARLDFVKELGDVLWYLSAVSSYLGIELQTVADTNIKKLADRQQRGKLNGSGDNR